MRKRNNRKRSSNSPIRHFSNAFVLIMWGIWLLSSRVIASTENHQLFDQGYQSRGADYITSRDLLVQKGTSIIPFLEQKRKVSDWQQVIFAEILLERINNASAVTAWNSQLMGWEQKRTHIQAAKRLPEPKWDQLPRHGTSIPSTILVDHLWSYNKQNRRDPKLTNVALQFYIHPDFKVARAVLEALPENTSLTNLAPSAFEKLGDAMTPIFREVLLETRLLAIPFSQDTTTQEKQRHRLEYWNKHTKRIKVAADGLGRLKDKPSSKLIQENLAIYLDTSWLNDRHATKSSSQEACLVSLFQSLASMRDFDTSHTLLITLSKVAHKSTIELYQTLRRSAISMGSDWVPSIQGYLKNQNDPFIQTILTSIIQELAPSSNKDKELALLKESLFLEPTFEKFKTFCDRSGEDSFPLFQQIHNTHRLEQEECIQIIELLGSSNEIRIVPLVWYEMKHFKQLLQYHLRSANIDIFNIEGEHQHITISNMQMLRVKPINWKDIHRDHQIATMLYDCDRLITILSKLNCNETITVLQQIEQWPGFKIQAQIALLKLNQEIKRLEHYLVDPNQVTRETAALAFIDQPNELVVMELFRAAAKRRGVRHQRWKQHLRSSQADLTSMLHSMQTSANIRERVLAEAMLLENKLAQQKKQYDETIGSTTQNLRRLHSIHINDVKRAGKTMAKKLDLTFLTFLEADCLFNDEYIRPGLAAFVLAEFKQPQSMPVLAASLDMPRLDGNNPAALALIEFGTAGAELAAKAPAPVTGRIDTGRRMTRHRGSVRVLAEHKPTLAASEIVKGLRTLTKDKRLAHRNVRYKEYLDSAEKCHDPVLVEPLLRILRTNDSPERLHHQQVMLILADYDDERLIPLFTEKLASLNSVQNKIKENSFEGALIALTKQLKEQTPEYLIKQAKESNDPRIRGAALFALGVLSYPEGAPYPAKGRWLMTEDAYRRTQWSKQSSNEMLGYGSLRFIGSRNTQPLSKESDSTQRFTEMKSKCMRYARQTRRLAYPVLVAHLSDPNSYVNTMAAWGLTILAQGNRVIAANPNAVVPLTKWCCSQGQCFYPTQSNYLSTYGNATTGAAFLRTLKALPADKSNIGIVLVIQKLKPRGAVPTLLRNAKAQASKESNPLKGSACQELEALGQYQEQGAVALLEAFNYTQSLSYREKAAKLLGELHYEPAADALEAALRHLVDHESDMIKNIRSNFYRKMCQRAFTTMLKALKQIDPQKAQDIAKHVLVQNSELFNTAGLVD